MGEAGQGKEQMVPHGAREIGKRQLFITLDRVVPHACKS